MEMLRAEPWCYYPLTLQVRGEGRKCHFAGTKMPSVRVPAAARQRLPIRRPPPPAVPLPPQFLSSTHSGLRGKCAPPPAHMTVIVAPIDVS